MNLVALVKIAAAVTLAVAVGLVIVQAVAFVNASNPANTQPAGIVLAPLK